MEKIKLPKTCLLVGLDKEVSQFSRGLNSLGVQVHHIRDGRIPENDYDFCVVVKGNTSHESVWSAKEFFSKKNRPIYIDNNSFASLEQRIAEEIIRPAFAGMAHDISMSAAQVLWMQTICYVSNEPISGWQASLRVKKILGLTQMSSLLHTHGIMSGKGNMKSFRMSEAWLPYLAENFDLPSDFLKLSTGETQHQIKLRLRKEEKVNNAKAVVQAIEKVTRPAGVDIEARLAAIEKSLGNIDLLLQSFDSLEKQIKAIASNQMATAHAQMPAHPAPQQNMAPIQAPAPITSRDTQLGMDGLANMMLRQLLTSALKT